MERYMDTTLPFRERAEALTDKLTTEEQAQQLRYDAPPIPQAGLPAYNWWNEGLHGVARAGTATVFPQAIALAAMFDDDMVRKAAEIISEEARAKYNSARSHGDCDIYKGLTMWSPNVNIFRDPRWGRGHETYGEDPFLTSRNGVAFVKGLQGEGKYIKTAACAKHFAAHSGPEADRHSFDAVVSDKDLEETYLPAFKALVEEAHVEGVMGAYNLLNGEPSCASKFLMGKLKEWGFKGYFTSDCWALRDFHTTYLITATAPESAALALKSGCDINCGNTYLLILAAMDRGYITPEDIRRSCIHALRTRIRLGQLDKTEYDDIPYSVVSCPKHRDFSLKCAEKACVMLKNNGILPIDEKKVKTIALIGPNSDSREALIGNYNGTPDRYVTFLEGIEDRFKGRVLYSEGCHLYKDRTQNLAQPGDRFSEAVTAAENADVIIACVGLDASMEGEQGDTSNDFSAGDRADLRLPESQRELLKRLRAVGKPMVTVVAAGGSINIEIDSDAVIDVWYAGQFGGTALAEILFGDISPSGKLPVTFYKNADKLPRFVDYSMKGRTYRYCDSDNVLYPFGYGLTYSKFKCSELKYAGGMAEVTVENIGTRDVEDVIELYIKGYEKEDVPNVSLCGFKRIFLKAGERGSVRIPVPSSAFETVGEDGSRAVKGKKFTLYAGTSQPDEISAALTGTSCASIEITI